jgi:hypothetical protein
MLGPDGAHLLVGRELTAISSGLGASNRLALFGRKDNRRRKIGACKLHDGARYVILIVRRQATHDLHCFIEELRHFCNIWSGSAKVENRSREVVREYGCPWPDFNYCCLLPFKKKPPESSPGDDE